MRIGADEAGKGPVLGSMFAVAVRAPSDAIHEGVDDSKRLSPARREELAAGLRNDDRVEVGVHEIPVPRIDGDEDMNTLTVLAQAEAVAAVARDGDGGVLDAGDASAERFARRVAERVPADVDLRAEHSADESYQLVGAASVLAKVERDTHVEGLAEAYGDVGSGYPSDPTTREFLRNYVETHGDLPDCARRSWSTCDDALAAAEQSALDSF
jgi:ribonuclease HII